MSEGIELRGLARRFGSRWILRGIDGTIEPGEVIAITGRNGSGKTTLLRVCATLLRPTRGDVTIFGHDIVKDGAFIRERVGFLAHDAGIYANLTAEENLEFALRMSGGRADRNVIAQALDRVGLKDVTRERTRGFSAGMRRRLALARLLIRPPRLLLLDEPYASFDVDGIDLVNEFTSAVAGAGGIALVATHDLIRARGVMNRELRIENGRMTESAPHSADEWVGALDGEPGS